MASTIKLKNGSGAPTAGDLVQGEPALDLTNKRLYTEDAGGTVVEVGTNPTALTIGGTALTATAAELNVLDGITATTAELNILDGVTATTAEINVLDGITATTAELNYTDGVTSNIQTQLNTKAPIDDATFTGTTTIPTADINGGTIDDTVIGGTTAAAGTFTTGQFDTSVNVDGTVTAGGLTVDAGGTTAILIQNANPGIVFDDTSAAGAGSDKFIIKSVAAQSLGDYEFVMNNDQTSSADVTVAKFSGNGDISFYEDTGTTAKLFWSSGIESLGIGSSTLSNIGAAIQLINGGLFVSGDLTNTNVNGFTLGYDGTNAKLAVNGTSGASRGMTFGTVAGGNEHTRMTIEPTGNVGIGTSSPDKRLDVVTGTADTDIAAFTGASTGRGLVVSTFSASAATDAGVDFDAISGLGAISFSTGTTERVRITSTGACEWRPDGTTQAMTLDSTGNVLVGTTTDVSASASGTQIIASGYIRTGRDTTSTRVHHEFYNPNGLVGTIQTSASATLYNISSDERLKENITDAPAGNIDDIKVRSFDWKVDGLHQEYGMVAQELEAVAPYAVTKGETEDDMWSVDYSKLVPMLIKEIQDLKAEVAALKGAN